MLLCSCQGTSAMVFLRPLASRSRLPNRVAPSTGWPPNAVEMLHTGVDRQLRVFGHDLQNRRWTEVRVPQHCRDLLEGHRAGAYLRVTKHIERRVCGIQERQVIAELQYCFRLFPCKVTIGKIVANADLVPPERIEEEPKIVCAVQIAQRMVFDDQLHTSPSRDRKQHFKRPTEAVGQCLIRRRKNRIGLSGIDDDAL